MAEWTIFGFLSLVNVLDINLRTQDFIPGGSSEIANETSKSNKLFFNKYSIHGPISEGQVVFDISSSSSMSIYTMHKRE